MKLVIGNQNYSSWSMRPWVLMRQLGLPFEEVKVWFDFHADSLFRREVARYSPAGRVPVLVDDDGFAVWDSLAIAEYLHERFPEAGVWPQAARDRARARCLAAEMHSGFSALRSACPMNIEASLPDVGRRLVAEQAALRNDLARLEQMWGEALAASGGPMLFGAFSTADAFFAPVCMRIRSYALPVGEQALGYVQRVAALPGVAAWIDAALAEQRWVPEDEPYRQPPGPAT
jgi:glutathione S-transferase